MLGAFTRCEEAFVLPMLAVKQDKASALANSRRTRVPRRPVSATKSTGRSNT